MSDNVLTPENLALLAPARGEGSDPARDVGIDWAHERFDVGAGDPCWPHEGRIHVKLHIECSRWMERMSKCTSNSADACDGTCCEQYVDPVEMCYRDCWIAGAERLDDRCGPQ